MRADVSLTLSIWASALMRCNYNAPCGDEFLASRSQRRAQARVGGSRCPKLILKLERFCLAIVELALRVQERRCLQSLGASPKQAGANSAFALARQSYPGEQ